MNRQHKLLTHPRYAWLQAFLCALPIAACIFLPFVIMDKGMFFYYGDFNVQQIPFYQLVHRAVRSGDVFWNWFTDLGANFIGSYSFYNLFSPFFWLTIPFPNEALPYLMAPLLALKTACAAATGALFVSRFVRDHRFAVIGGLLYAFSGFTAYNVFFNHFHEVIVVFPLMLYALELLVVDGRRGWFGLSVALNAMINYWFFIGSVAFIVLYFIVRTASRGWGMSWRKFFAVAAESSAGVLLSGAALLPSVLAIMGNPRTTPDNILSGWGFWLYSHEQRLPAILQSVFFPPDIPARTNFFPDHGAKWASMSAWLPMTGPSLVIGYLLSTPRSWLKRVLWSSLFIACVPGLNAVFILFNNSYYARWFYMPVLLMALASVLTLERYRSGEGGVQLMRGLRVAVAVTAMYVAAIGFTPVNDDGEWKIGLMKYADRFWLYAAVAALGLAATWLLISRLRRHPLFMRVFGASLGGVCVLYSVMMIALGRDSSYERGWMRDVAVDGAEQLYLPKKEGGFDRVDVYDNMDNLAMYWKLPNIQAFHSIIPVSLMEFYPSVGVKRDVSSKPQPEFYALRSLLSVKWLFVADDEPEDKQPSTPYFSYYDHQLGFNIYENDNYLPMGLGYDRYVTRTQWEEAAETDRPRLIHKGVLIEDADVRNVRQIISRLPDEEARALDEDTFLEDVETRRGNAASSFERDQRGFTSELNLSSDQVVFYSVPYDQGWSAEVDGVPTAVLRVNGGFCGVPVNAGAHTVRFDYMAPGLRAGVLMSLAGLALLAALIPIGRRFPLAARPGLSCDRRLDGKRPVPSAPADGAAPGGESGLPDDVADAFVWGGEESGQPSPGEDASGAQGDSRPARDPEREDGEGGSQNR